MRVKLTNSFISNNLKCPDGKPRLEFCDSELPGLYVEVRASSPGQGSYYLRYKDSANSTKHQKIGRTCDIDLVDARKQAKVLKAEIALGASPRAEAKAQKEVPTFSTFFEKHYLPYVKPRKRSWRRDNELYTLRIKDVFGSKRLNQITRHSLQIFHGELLEQGLAPATCDHHLKLLKHALNLAIDWSMLNGLNPAARVPLFNRDNKVEHYLEQDQLETLLTVLRTDGNRAVCLIAMLLLSTGARLNEALSAKWCDIDRVTRVWRIPALNSKSKRIRAVPLNESAIDVMQQLDTEGEFDHLFVNRTYRKENPGYGKPYRSIMKVWSRLRNKAGLPHLRIHDLRHQFASFLVNSGRTLYEVQSILGHSDAKVTQRYAHLSTKSMQEAANTASVIIKGAILSGEVQSAASA